MKLKLDFKSIKFKTFMYFVLFAGFLMILLWSLQVIFLNNFYGIMKTNQTKTVAEELQESYRSNDETDFMDDVTDLSRSYDLNIFVVGYSGGVPMLVYTPSGEDVGRSYVDAIHSMYDDMMTSGSQETQRSDVGEGGPRKVFAYAAVLHESSGDADLEEANVLYIFSPLEGEGIRGDGQAKWYVVHTYSGHENKVKVNIEKMVENRGMQDLILDIVVPTEDRVEVKDGQRKIKTRKMFPGYVIIKMVVTNESWYLVRNTQGVTGFVGHGSEPIPLTTEEVARMGIEKVNIDLDVNTGDTVRVISGPFESLMGEVLEVNPDKQVLTVKVSMFGRDTPVELEFSQVDKLN